MKLNRVVAAENSFVSLPIPGVYAIESAILSGSVQAVGAECYLVAIRRLRIRLVRRVPRRGSVRVLGVERQMRAPRMTGQICDRNE